MKDQRGKVVFKIGIIFILIFSCSKKNEADKNIQITKKEIAVLNSFSNFVETKRNNAIDWEKAKPNQFFSNYDKVKTGIDSSANVLFKDHSELIISQESIAIIVDRIQNDKVDKGILSLNSGSIKGSIFANQNKNNILEIQGYKKSIQLKNQGKDSAKFTMKLNKNKSVSVKKESGEKLLINVESQEEELKSLEEINIVIDENEKVQLVKSTQIIPKPKEVKEKPKTKKLEPSYMLYSPKKDMTTSKKVILVKGHAVLYKVLLNGEVLKSSPNFKKKFSLNMGVNILTFQFIYQDKVEFKVIKVIRK